MMTYPVYQFTAHELKTIHDFVELSEWGIPQAYRWYKGIKSTESIRTGDVEDFAVSFFTQYNRECKRIY